ncbi:flagellar hook-basal body complex protein FliE [Halochromatium glycolicum]|jgi:flagellar hook-basal body complex protein FliE|uniref:Flagellar hook-basal body complex protein FliE n=1 Tax=Halochromatium glycolicum TaxID=85075 RepID=A0AAJ0U163_9GAMM|nr:flagellar hook-basal body complex protein FliE [Halochromatium glycolicum]MBK1703346.1 flagellar hook-basal body complex protein FliE [Halochromatium glycolicum]
MSTAPALESALTAMRALAAEAGGGPRQATPLPGGAGGFAGELQAAIQRINTLKLEAADKAKAFQAGDPDISLNDLMIDMQKASVASQFGLQLRNRLVTAYRDVMNMQV